MRHQPRTPEQQQARWARDVELRIYREQTALITAEYDKKTADAANYGWGVDIAEDMVSVSTKVYGIGVLSSIAIRGQQHLDHQWR